MAVIKYPANVSKFYLLKLSIPIFFSNLAIPMTGIVDSALMGHLDSELFLVATSIATNIILLIFWSFGFLRMGTVGLVSQAMGKGDYREIVLIVLRNIILVIFISILLLFLYIPIINFIDIFFNVSDKTLSFIKQYIFIRLFSAPAEFIIYILIGFYLGLQKTHISSLITIFFSLINIILSILLVAQFKLQIAGVAFGTLGSAYITVIIFSIFTYFYIIKNLKIIPRINVKIFNIKKIYKLIQINFDIFIRTVLLTFSFLWISYLSSKLGEEYVAVNSILIQLVTIAAFFLDAYAFSTEGVVGYNLGRRAQKTFLTTVKNSIELSFFTAIIISILYIFISKEIINLMTNLDIIRYLSYEFIIWIIIIPPVASFCYQFDGIFIGATQTKEMKYSMIISVSIYIFISMFLLKLLGNHGIWISLIFLYILRALTLNLFFYKILRKF